MTTGNTHSSQVPVNKAEHRTVRIRGDGMLNTITDRRIHDRIPVRVQARFFCGNKIYSGKIIDVSEKGMFVCTDMTLPRKSRLEIMILVNRKVLTIPVMVRRRVKREDLQCKDVHSGIGVEFIDVPQSYIQYLNVLKPFARN